MDEFDDRWTEFVHDLVSFVYQSKSHVATLNYDDLLYAPFNEVHNIDGQQVRLCSGFNGTLLDGYTHGNGFSSANMERLFNPENKAWYMHLHGSPLFADNENGDAVKLTRHQLQVGDNAGRSHIVLTHGSLKPVVISSSKVLQMYWEHLDAAMAEVAEIVVFGYSGRDRHLNTRIRAKRGDANVRVVERTHEEDRQQFWNGRLGPTELVQLDDVLLFDDW